jgi:hypothetical protein
LDQRLINETEFLTRKSEIELQFETLRNESELTKYEADQLRNEEALQKQLVSYQEYTTAKDQLEANYVTAKAKRDSELLKKDTETKTKLIQAEERLQQQKVHAVGETFGNLASLMQTSSRELFAIGKAAALAQAGINTYEAITKTMAFTPYPFNIPLAAAQGIAGAVQVAKIASTNPSFEQGGIVPGSSFAGDRVQANVNSGEMILNRTQQATLFRLANGASGSDGLMSKIDQLIGLLVAKDETVIVNIGGKTVVDTLRSELAAGRTFA